MAQPSVLKPYQRRSEPGLLQRGVLALALLALAALYGLLCLVLPFQLLVIPAVPILLGIGLIFWMLPDVGGMQQDRLGTAMIAYVACNVLWPGYMALNLPGLPWITPTRLALFALMSVALVNYATSSELRSKVTEVMWTRPWIARAFWLFWATTVFALAVSVSLADSLNKFFNNQIYWTAIFCLACWLASHEGFADRFGRVVAWTIIPVALAAINEYRVSSVIWAPYLPTWLQGDPEQIAKVMSFNGRAYTGIYRARGTFGGALYFAEYLAISFPFVLHRLVMAKELHQRVLLTMAALAVASAMVFTNSRSAALAMLLSPMVMIFLGAWRGYRGQAGSLKASAIVFGYPVLAGVFVALVIFWGRLHVMVIGGAQHQGSSDARATQWAMGWPKVFAAPFGSGAGTSGGVLGFYNGGSDQPTVDTYFLTLLLDYGFLGLAAFAAMLGVTLFYGWQAYNRARRADMLVLAPLVTGLLNFFIIKSVSSTESSLPIVFIMIGCIVGLIAQQDRDDLAKVPGRRP